MALICGLRVVEWQRVGQCAPGSSFMTAGRRLGQMTGPFVSLGKQLNLIPSAAVSSGASAQSINLPFSFRYA